MKPGKLTRTLNTKEHGPLLFYREVSAIDKDGAPLRIQLTLTESKKLFLDASLFGQGTYIFESQQYEHLKSAVEGSLIRFEPFLTAILNGSNLHIENKELDLTFPFSSIEWPKEK